MGALALLRDESGQSMAEYGLLTALIAVVCLVAVRTLGQNIRDKVREISDEIANATPG